MVQLSAWTLVVGFSDFGGRGSDSPENQETATNDVRIYRERNLIERMFGRLKDFRRVATRYGKLARNFLATVLLAALIIWWLRRSRFASAKRLT